MKIVGDHLAHQAGERTSDNERDLFGRSAFNRYYYSAFLAIRDTLKKLDANWAKPAHKSMPELLTGEVVKRAKRTAKIAVQSGTLPNPKADHLIRSLIHATNEISVLLNAARETRRLADYEPEARLLEKQGKLQLGHDTLESAKHWENRVNAQASTILRIYEQLGLI